MHENINIEFRHALYDFQGHHSGAKLGDHDATKQAISELVDGADMALYRNEGYFFDTVGEQMFVFGRLVEWNSVRSGECFFDLYATSVRNLRDVSVTDVAMALLNRSQRVSEKSQPIEQSVSITVPHEAAGSEPRADTTRVDPNTEDDRNAQGGPNATRNDANRTDMKTDSRDGEPNRTGESQLTKSSSDGWVSSGDPNDCHDGDRHENADGESSNRPGRDERPSSDADRSGTTADPVEPAGGHDTSAATDEDPNAASAPDDENPNAPSTAGDDDPNANSMSDDNVGLSDDDLRFIAQFWEQYRRGTDPVKGSVDVVDRMARLVDGTLSNVRFVSRVDDQGDPYHFDVVGERNDTSYDVAALADTVAEVTEGNSIRWQELPTYEEELDNLVTSRREHLQPKFETAADKSDFEVPFETFQDRFDRDRLDGINEPRLRFYYDTWNAFVDEYWETLATFEAVVHRRATETLTEAVDPNTDFIDEREESESLIDKMSGLVSGRTERNVGSEVRNVDVNHVDDAEIKVVMRRVSEQALKDTYERLDDRVSEELRKRLEQRARSISLETVRQLDAIRDSRAYRETYRDAPTE